MATRPPRATYRARQPTTGRGRIVRQPANPFVSRGTLAGMKAPKAPKAPSVPAASSVAAVPAAPAYSVSDLPPDPSYDATIAGLQRQRGDTLAGLTQARTSGLSDYGFTEGPNGALTFNPNDPFSQAAEMKKAFDTNRRSTAQSLGAGGQLYSGAFQNAQDLVNRNQVQGEDRLQKSLINFLARNTQGVTQANTGYETAAGQAYGDRVSRFQDNPLYDPATAASTPAAAAPVAPAGTKAATTSAAAAMRRRARLTGARIGRI